MRVDKVKVRMMLVALDAHTYEKRDCLTVLAIVKNKDTFQRTFSLDDGAEWECDDEDYVYVTKKRF